MKGPITFPLRRVLQGRLAGYLPRFLLAVLPMVLAISHVSGGPGWQGIDRLDALMQDARMRLTAPRTLEPRIVIVDIDDNSLAEVGPWPWPRDRLARLTDELFERQQVSQAGFGLVFEAPLDHDDAFARALRQRAVVLGYDFLPGLVRAGRLPSPAMPAARLQGRPVGFFEWPGYSASLPRLAAAAPVAGFLNAPAQPDGRVRALPLLALHAGEPFESFALALYRQSEERPAIAPGYAPPQFPARYHGLSHLQLGEAPDTLSVPVGERATARIPFLGPAGPESGSFRYVSATDLLAGRVPAGTLQGKQVLVGSTAAGVGARHATPFGADVPAIELHATMLSGLLEARLPVRPDYAAGYGLLVLLGAGLLLALALPVLRPWQGVGLGLGVICTVLGLNLWLSVQAGLELPLAPALLMGVASVTLSLGHAGWRQWHWQRRLARLYAAQWPPELVRPLRSGVGDAVMRATRRPMTVLFCGIRGFGPLSEGLEPAALQTWMQRVLGRFTQVILDHGGTLDKHTGDGLMAFWGAPGSVTDPARRAVAAALALTHAVQTLNDEHRRQGLPEIALGIGLNSGSLCVGDMGSPLRPAYTVVGEAVNLAARLQRLSKAYGVSIVAGEATRREADDFDWLELDKVRLHDRSRTVTLHTPSVPSEDRGPAATDDARTWAALLKAYRAQDVRSCERLLDSLDPDRWPRPLRALYARRVAAMRGGPPDPRWDGAACVEGVRPCAGGFVFVDPNQKSDLVFSAGWRSSCGCQPNSSNSNTEVQ